MLRIAVIAASALALAGCDIIYTSPDVEKTGAFGLRPNTDFKVEEIDLTYETAVEANLDPYIPQRLPAAFQPEVVAAQNEREEQLVRQSLTSLGSVPALPGLTGPVEVRPSGVAERLPPRLEPRPYTIGVSDVLLLSVNAPASLEDLPALIEAAAKRQGYVVQDDGAIAIPDVGRVIVAGLTLQDAEAAIFEAVASAGIDPSFTVEIAEFNSKRVAVGGDVGNPSVVPITLKPLYLNEALQLSGGLRTTDPEVTEIQIFREGQEYRISAERFLNTPGLQRFLLLDGDSVFVSSNYNPGQAQRRFGEVLQLRAEQLRTTQTLLSLEDKLNEERQLFRDRLELGAVQREYVYYTGETRQSGRVALPFENRLNLNDVLLGNANGVSIRTGDWENIYVLRGLLAPDQFGGVRAYKLDAENAVNLIAANTFLMQPNDVVFVAEQPVTAWNRAISQLVPNLILGLPNRLEDFAGFAQ